MGRQPITPPVSSLSLARRLDPGLEDRDFADASAQLDRMPDGVFTRYGPSPEDVARLREEFAVCLLTVR